MKNGYIKKAWNFYKLARKEVEEAKVTKTKDIAVDGCAKGFLALTLATKGLFLNKGLKNEKIPRTYTGMRYLLQKYASKELVRKFYYLRDVLHIDGYYEQIIEYEILNTAFEDLGKYIKSVENL